MVFILVSGTLRADYVPPSLNKLIIKADKIIYGTIQCVDERIIEVKLEGGSDRNDQTISINKFQEWICGKRWSEYQVGQRSIYFLKYKEDGFYPMGGGNEGEMPLQGSQAYVHYSTISQREEVKIFKRSEVTVEENGYNNPYGGYVLPLEDLWETIKKVRKCFKADFSATGNLENVRSICSEKEYEDLLVSNKVLAWAMAELKHL